MEVEIKKRRHIHGHGAVKKSADKAGVVVARLPVGGVDRLLPPTRAAEIESPSWTQLALRVDSNLLPLHRQRAADLGVDESGLLEHYKTRVDLGAIATRSDVMNVVETIERSLPAFDSYHVLRAGLGEIAFLLSALGKRVVAYEANVSRFAAIEAGLEVLKVAAPDIVKHFSVMSEVVPDAHPGVLGVANHLVGIYAHQEEDVLTRLSRYSALLIEPRVFLRPRPSMEEQDEIVEELRRRGFLTIHKFPNVGLVYCAKRNASAMSPPYPSLGTKKI